MDLGLAGKVAIVTGASRGIGRAVVEELASEGVLVVGGARTAAGLDVPGAVGVAVDLSTPEGPVELVRVAVDTHGGVDFLVNCAGAARLHLVGGFADTTDDDWSWGFETVLMSAVRTTRAALPHLQARAGAIVNVSSVNARDPAGEAPEYSAMKAALTNLSRALAAQLGPAGVRVNTVSPGLTMTAMQTEVAEQVAAATDTSAEGYFAEAANAVSLGRFAQPAEVAAVVVALLSGRFGYVNGADVAVDGALTGG